jgi:ankyrin repeat protein
MDYSYIDPLFAIEHHASTELLARAIPPYCEEHKLVEYLVAACEHDNQRAVRWLAQNKQCPLTSVLQTLLYKKFSSLDTIRLLLSLGASCGAVDPESGKAAIHISIITSNEVTEVLLKHDRSCVNVPDEHGLYPIHIACCWKDVKFVDMLVRYGADVNVKTTKGGFTTLFFAMKQEGKEEAMVRYLVEQAGMNVWLKSDTDHILAFGNSPGNIGHLLKKYETSTILAILLSAWIPRIGGKSQLTTLIKDMIRHVKKYLM